MQLNYETCEVSSSFSRTGQETKQFSEKVVDTSNYMQG